jgi:uncharacterized protein DUF4252
MSKQKSLLAAVALLGVCAAAHAQNGFFDFSKIPGLNATPSVTIDLNAAMLGFVTAATQEADPEAASMLAGIRGVRVYVYENVADGEAAAVQRFVDSASGKLESEGWHRAVFVQDGEDKVRMYVKIGDPAAPSRLSGLTVMVAGSSGEAVFINVDGQIDPSQLGRLAAQFAPNGKLNGLSGLGGAAPPGQNGNDPE